jgi:hypothetical protein
MEASKALVEKKDSYRNKVVSIIKENFNKSTELGKQLYLYKQILDESNIPARLAISFVKEIDSRNEKINKTKLFNEQTALIKKINSDLGAHVFENFVSDYRILGNVYHLFSLNDDDIKSKISLQESIAAQIISENEKEKNTLTPIDNITYNVYVKKFNEKYGSSLIESQKQLLKNYIYSIKDNGISFKIYISEEVSNIKNNLLLALKEGNFKDEEVIQNKLKTVVEKIESFKSQPLDSKMITDIMLMQQLTEELRAND